LVVFEILHGIFIAEIKILFCCKVVCFVDVWLTGGTPKKNVENLC
jgi:hypothetical protein